MYVRPQGERGIKIPENYSGHAFRDPRPFGDMPPPAHVPTSQGRERVIIPSAVTPKSSPTYAPEPERAEEERFAIDEDVSPTHESIYEEAPPGGDTRSSSISSSIFSSLLPTTSQASHFPFGHGIGSEELLILAVMLLVFLSEESDQELLLLLGFLLFAG